MKERIEKLIENKQKECQRLYENYIALNPQDNNRKRIHQNIMWEYDAILRDIRNMEV